MEMARTWVLDTSTKGTGAQVVPLDKALPGPEPKPDPPPRRSPAAPSPAPKRRPRREPIRSRTPLPPGHVRKKSTGELGRVQAVDARAGTARVLWLRRGSASTVPLSAITRS
ncbi:MAG: hypothetical protein ACM3UV_08380 [Nocardioidaceae bacterium]